MEKSYVMQTLREARLWKPGESDTFTHNGYNIRLEREEQKYAPFIWKVQANKTFPTHTVHTGRRYMTMESAFLHILNSFNENVNIPDKYKSVGQWFDEQ
ncbi:MAG: hypothetical protein IJ557_02295 [Bacteroidaceae bacterium]|nr:hypothetical protein [Bacteroidaceae bacterium]